ncbi:MAG: UvrB/UvrC motif-containing protein [Victivallaceae bacterium]|nr:UvrB/UvrC motif-containing protein [Victivallaceae bacterium]
MLCDICKKNEATIHIKEIHDGKVKSTNLCASCAAEKEKNGGLDALGFNLGEMLLNLGSLAAGKTEAAAIEPDSGKTVPVPAAVLPPCPVCGWTVEKIGQSGGRLGCPACYKAFTPLINEVLTRVQRGLVHIGKRPRNAAGGDVAVLTFEVGEAKRELQEHISREEYELAAVCRDRIRQLQARLDESRQGGGENGQH